MKKKILHGFSYSKSMAKFVAFLWKISSSILNLYNFWRVIKCFCVYTNFSFWRKTYLSNMLPRIFWALQTYNFQIGGKINRLYKGECYNIFFQRRLKKYFNLYIDIFVPSEKICKRIFQIFKSSISIFVRIIY